MSNAPPPAATNLRMGIALRAVFQSEAWLGAHAGTFSRLGIDLTFPAIATGGPAAMAGAIRGDWDVCHTGALPIMQGVLRGEDPVLLITPTELHEAVFVMARREFTTLAQLNGQRIGAVDASGQFGRPLKILLEQSGIDAEMLSLGSFQAIDAALTKGEIAAGYLPIDLRFRGESQHGWNALTGLPIVGGIATTRRFIASHHQLVAGFVKGVVDAIHLFKTRPDIVIPLLQQFLEIAEREPMERLHAFYAPLFRAVPAPTFFTEMEGLCEGLAEQYPAARSLRMEDVADASFVEELEGSGYIDELYAG
jgi:ABC-type nitrate/sulfonate/bicarbonate transport system substrate-binding protein